MKICSSCKVNKSLSDFHVNPRYRLGVTGICRICRNAQIKARAQQVRLIPKPVIAEKTCGRCHQSKAVTQFGRSAVCLDGYQSSCLECRANRERLGRMDPQRALRQRLRFYGMTIPDLYDMINAQRGLCSICEKPFAKPVIDHDHDTGAVRGLLCCRCNNWLAAIECPDYVERARGYLLRHQAIERPFRVNMRWVEQRKRHKAETKARRLA